MPYQPDIPQNRVSYLRLLTTKFRKISAFSVILALFSFGLVGTATAVEPAAVTDALGIELRLEEPPQRIISLAPHITETLFALGVGDRLVATVTYSDYPPEARDIPRIGSDQRLDIEAIVAKQPDLIIAWASGNSQVQLQRLRDLGIPLYHSNPQTVEALTDEFASLGQLLGVTDVGASLAEDFRSRIQRLTSQYADANTLSVFLQIWDRPLMTLNERHMAVEAINLCGGESLFSELSSISPTVDMESLLAADPQVILVAGPLEGDDRWVTQWQRWDGLQAVRQEQVIAVSPSLLLRATPRLIEGIEEVCAALDQARRSYAESSR